MAGEKLGYVYGAFAGADLVGKEGLFCGITGAKEGLPIVGIATDAIAAHGVILRGDVEGTTVRICNQGIVMVQAGGVIAAGAEVEVKTGKAITKATGIAVGIALAVAADGDMIPVMLS